MSGTNKSNEGGDSEPKRFEEGTANIHSNLDSSKTATYEKITC
jgi:hypothetical protein